MITRSHFFRAWLVLALTGLCTTACASTTHAPGRTTYHAPAARSAPTIDGRTDAVWSSAPWQALEHRWLGPEHTSADFNGRYKVMWTPTHLYILAEITDDILIDTHRDPLVQYWDDDCLEIFLDEDFSGGNHQYNHNAFAYHLSLDNQAIDIGTNQQAQSYSHHVNSRWRQQGDKIIWEVAIEVYADNYVDGADDNQPVPLTSGKVMGLMVAYCDNDGSDIRENFIGSEAVLEGATDRGWIDAGIFGRLILDE
ncbi:MAG: CBM9 family sugar-binding protein [Pseudomonadota bacterium]